ncbi:TetR family transcriptional regulator [Solirubrobacter soli]|uniref:TetR family transcriptional regulator n=1 Tax=Solirubrobacter soli TaxID=363832 RepID=UPI0004244B4C|nr:TetR family transcriptional regulator C-terminal domain-containing protein [Solirubrobacter soli]
MTGSLEISRHAALRSPTTAAALGRGSIITGRRPAATMRTVLDAAAALVAQRGVRAVTPATVSAAAGYQRGVVTTRFANRAALLDALTLDLQDGFQVPISDKSGREQLRDFADAYLREAAERSERTRAFATLWAAAQAGEPDLQEAFAARDARLKATLADYVRQGIVDGTIRGDLHPEATAFALLGRLRLGLLNRALRTG